MSDEIRIRLQEFKNLSENILRCISEDKFDEIEGLISKREEIIKYISSLVVDKDEIKKLFAELQIQELHDQLQKSMADKRMHFKNELFKLSKQKEAFNSYNKAVSNKPRFIEQQR